MRENIQSWLLIALLIILVIGLPVLFVKMYVVMNNVDTEVSSLQAVTATIGSDANDAHVLLVQLTNTVTTLNATSSTLNTTLQTINDQTIPELNHALITTDGNLQNSFNYINGEHGTLIQLNKSILAAKSSLTHLDMVIDHEYDNLDTLDQQELQLYGHLTNTLDLVNATLGDPAIKTTAGNIAGITSDVHTVTSTLVAPGVGKHLSFLDRLRLLKTLIRGQ